MLMQLFDLTLSRTAELFAIPITRRPISGIRPRPEELLDEQLDLTASEGGSATHARKPLA